MEKQLGRELLDSGWLAHYGQEAAEMKLTKPQMEMCRSLGITPAQFKASKDVLDVTETMGRDLSQPHKSTGDKNLTVEQLRMCNQLGITGEEFKKAKERLNQAQSGLVVFPD